MQANMQQAFREFLVSPTLISNLKVHKSVGLSHVKCKILTSFLLRHSSVHFSFYLIGLRVSRDVSIKK